MFFEFLEIFNLNYIDLYDSYSYNDKSEKFDQKVIKLYEEGNSYLKISQMMNVDKETIRQIILKNK